MEEHEGAVAGEAPAMNGAIKRPHTENGAAPSVSGGVATSSAAKKVKTGAPSGSPRTDPAHSTPQKDGGVMNTKNDGAPKVTKKDAGPTAANATKQGGGNKATEDGGSKVDEGDGKKVKAGTSKKANAVKEGAAGAKGRDESGPKTPKPTKQVSEKRGKEGRSKTPKVGGGKTPTAANEGGGKTTKVAKEGGGKMPRTVDGKTGGKTPVKAGEAGGKTPKSAKKQAKAVVGGGDGEGSKVPDGEERKGAKEVAASGKKRKSPGNTKSSLELHCPSPAAKALKEEAAARRQLRPIERVGTEAEERARMKPGSIRSILYQMLTEAGEEGMSAKQLIRVSTERKLRDWGDTKPKSLVMSVLCRDALFVRIRYGVYSTAYLFPDGVPEEATAKPRGVKPPSDASAEDAQPIAVMAKKARKSEASRSQTAKAVAPAAASGPAAAEKPDVKKPPADPLVALKLEDEKGRKQLESATKARNDAEARLTKVEADYKAEEARVQAAAPSKSSKFELHLEDMPSFDVTEEEKEYKGPSNDRKALLAHRRHVQELQNKAEQDKLAWIREQKNKVAKTRQEQRRAVEELGKERKKAQQTLSSATRDMEAAQRLCATVGASLERELAKASKTEEKQRERDEKERKRVAEREERERKRLEALDAKRYPIEDMQLQEELRAKGETQPEVALPEFSSQDEGALLARLLYVSDVTQRFCKELDIRPITMETLEAALSCKTVTDTGKKAVSGELAGFELVSQLYQGLLATILEDEMGTGLGSRIERRWASLLGPGTWPEVLRRYILLSHRAAEEEEGAVQLVGDEVARCARELSRRAPEDLAPGQHLLLLEALCNEALGTVELRDALTRRLEEADEVLKDLRAARAEDRKQIREVEDALRDERKRKREEAAREAAAKAEAAAAAAGALTGGAEGGTNGDGTAAAAVAIPVVEAGGNKDEEEEPSWELGPEFADFKGASDDRKGLLEWRQKVNAERQRLEKEKLRWHADKRRREKEREKALRAEMEAELAKQRELERLQEELEDKQEAYERELNKYIVRQTPLGSDRHFRRYWWGMGAARGVVYVESEGGEWAAITRPEELEALFVSLDKRGVREADLQESIDKNYQIICKAMKRAVWETEKAKKAEVKTVAVPERVLPRRSGSAKSKAEEAAAVRKADKPGLVEEEALEESTAGLEELATLAEEAGAQLPRIKSFGKLRAEVTAARGADIGAGAYAAVARLLSEVEEALYELSGQGGSGDEEEGTGEEEEEGEDVEENGKEGRVHRSRSNVSLASSSGLGARKRRGGQDIESEEEDGKEAEEVHEYVHSDAEGEDASGKELWRSGRRKTWLYAHIKERAAWKASLEGSTRLAAAAYNTGVLLEAAHGMTEALAGVKRKAEREAQAANKRQR